MIIKIDAIPIMLRQFTHLYHFKSITQSKVKTYHKKVQLYAQLARQINSMWRLIASARSVTVYWISQLGINNPFVFRKASCIERWQVARRLTRNIMQICFGNYVQTQDLSVRLINKLMRLIISIEIVYIFYKVMLVLLYGLYIL